MVNRSWHAGWLLGLPLLVACGSTPLRGQPDLLGFLADGSTTRAQVIERLGEPYHRLRAGALCTYRLSHDKAGQFVSPGRGDADWTGLDASVVLVFDENGVLRQHAVIRVREP